MRALVQASLVSLIALLASVTVSHPVQAAPPVGPSPEALEFFEKNVRPVLADNCFQCHGPKLQMGGLRLDNHAGFLKGAGGKPVAVAGAPDKSSLVQAVRYTGDVKMPPTGKLPDKDIQALTEWVQMGAPWPQETVKPGDTASAWSKHWAFLPVRNPPIPAVHHRDWVKSPIDAFVLAKLESKGMHPAPPADKRTLIRRATFDLIGLPPTLAEVQAFEQDKSPDAFAKVVDRLLASPHYGERWGRYWLDIARYADTKGYVFVEDRNYYWAYTYRDWVIKALNSDMPYDRFLVAQLAADQMSGKTQGDLAAMGFLTVGRRFLNSQPDIIADRIDVVSRGMMGLTVGCARCHDHKFDPIPTSDYYSFYGILASSMEPKDLPVIDTPARVESYAIYQRELTEREGVLAKYKESHKADLMAAKEPAKAEEARLQARVDAWKKGAPPQPMRAMVMEDLPQPVTQHVFLRGNQNNQGPEVGRHFVTVLAGNKPPLFTHGSGRLDLALDIVNPDNPLTPRVAVNRSWMHLFGAGIVRTPSDFGMRSDDPTHPELLDYLAWRFVHEGWSIKKLNREIMLSSTYQQSSNGDVQYEQDDPENRMLSRMNRRRLDFEAMRDSLLFTCRELDPSIGGPAVDITTAPFAKRRTVYGFIDRQNLPGLFRTFDFASPDSHSPQRFVTIVPQQALFMMNSPFTIGVARDLAHEIPAEGDSAHRIRLLYQKVYGRSPSARELNAGVNYLKSADAPEQPDAPLSPASAWQYGYGEVDPIAGRVKQFHPLHWSGQFWQGGTEFPDKTFGFIRLTGTGGHVGNDLQHAAIRRWVAPYDGVFNVQGVIIHSSKEGDGVHAMVLSSQSGKLGEWNVHNDQADTKLERVALKKGETLDFVVDCRAEPSFDSFRWSPSVHAAGEKAPANTASEWSALDDYSGPPTLPSQQLTPWERYAQVLLMTNEFAFID